jgi:DNA primase
MVLGTLFNAWKAAEEADQREYMAMGKPNNVAQFIQRYQIQFEKDCSLGPVLSWNLFVALKRISRDFGLVFNLNSSRQFAQRFSNDLDVIRAAGFSILDGKNNHGTRLYKIGMQEHLYSSKNKS